MVVDSKKVFWLLGTIILGALGSGLWDLVIKPSSIYLVKLFIDVVLGTFSGVQDSIYNDISSLEKEITGRSLLSYILGAFSGIVIFLCIVVFRKPKSKTDVKKELPKFMILLYGLFVITFTFFSVGKTGYIIEKQNKYSKLKMVISPYISHKEILLLDSNFALIKNMKNYDTLMLSMKEIAIKNNLLNKTDEI